MNIGKCGLGKWHMILDLNFVIDDILNLLGVGFCRTFNTSRVPVESLKDLTIEGSLIIKIKIIIIISYGIMENLKKCSNKLNKIIFWYKLIILFELSNILNNLINIVKYKKFFFSNCPFFCHNYQPLSFLFPWYKFTI